ncbi:hypothetical protein BC834DRAFT_58787 [Gloeopeniophorella convolvens]|nr:hypothetical protein BC834DRAFT_58787 [Gloeopeniophorella convolvens]
MKGGRGRWSQCRSRLWRCGVSLLPDPPDAGTYRCRSRRACRPRWCRTRAARRVGERNAAGGALLRRLLETRSKTMSLASILLVVGETPLDLTGSERDGQLAAEAPKPRRTHATERRTRLWSFDVSTTPLRKPPRFAMGTAMLWEAGSAAGMAEARKGRAARTKAGEKYMPTSKDELEQLLGDHKRTEHPGVVDIVPRFLYLEDSTSKAWTL